MLTTTRIFTEVVWKHCVLKPLPYDRECGAHLRASRRILHQRKVTLLPHLKIQQRHRRCRPRWLRVGAVGSVPFPHPTFPRHEHPFLSATPGECPGECRIRPVRALVRIHTQPRWLRRLALHLHLPRHPCVVQTPHCLCSNLPPLPQTVRAGI
jgi:hypothetical protein